MEEIKINQHIVELIKVHGYDAKIIGDKIIPNFKENIEIETWVYPKEIPDGVQTRFDIGIKINGGNELYEAFGDVGTDLTHAIQKNLENFTRSSFHVILDAFNDTDTCGEVENWVVHDIEFDVYIGDYNVKVLGNVDVSIPENLFSTLHKLISKYDLQEDYYFVRFFYAHHQNETMSIEFMINNINLEKDEQVLRQMDWMKTEDYYSIRNFMILKKVR